MAKLSLEENRVQAGVWQGLVTAPGRGPRPPVIEVSHMGTALPGVALAPVAGASESWMVRVPVPSELLCDGLQIFLVRDAETDETVGHFSIVTGEAVARDLVVEIDLLRAELDMLKRAFRRHCVDAGG